MEEFKIIFLHNNRLLRYWTATIEMLSLRWPTRAGLVLIEISAVREPPRPTQPGHSSVAVGKVNYL